MSSSRKDRRLRRVAETTEAGTLRQYPQHLYDSMVERMRERAAQGLPFEGPEVPTRAEEYRRHYYSLDLEQQARMEPPISETEERRQLRELVRRRQEWAAGSREDWR